tara:strand:- start:1577 stop:1741 length:165 start_codon:yes stop_codon:yes gene_type:complete
MKIQYIISLITITMAGYFAHLNSDAWPWFLGVGTFMYLAAVGSDMKDVTKGKKR